jgi:histidinol-phosphate aminotransferase
MKPRVPEPRNPIASPTLMRPNWITTPNRSPDSFWLDKNENLDPTLRKVIEKVSEEIDPLALCTYPEPGPFYQKLASYLDVPPEAIVLSAGSDGAIRYVFEAFVGAGDWVIHTLPTFAMYPVYSSMYGARVQALEYQASESGPSLRAEQVISAIQRVRPRAVFLPNPDSPTGTVFEPSELREIIETAGEAGAVILIDEAYHPFYRQSVVPWIHEYPNLIIARTFAKAWGLAGLRIGYAVSNPEIAGYLHKVRPMYETGTFSVAFMERMLDFASEMEASVKRLIDGKTFFLEKMRSFGCQTLQGHGNFLHVGFGERLAHVIRALEGKVLFRPDFKDQCLKGYSRFSSTTVPLFEPVVERIQEALRG